MRLSETSLIASASRVLEERLPPGWGVERLDALATKPRLKITSGEGRSRELAVAALAQADPRNARQIPTDRPLLVTAPYISRSTRETIAALGASYVDQTGNVRLVLDEPGLFVTTSGADANPWPEERQFSLRGTKAGRVVCALAESRVPLGVRQLASAAQTDPGYLSRLLAMLDREAMIERTARGHVERIDWKRLLVRWSEDAPLESRARASTWLAPRGLKSLWDNLRQAPFPYLVTGSAAGALVAPVAPTRLSSIYVHDAEGAAKWLGLRPTEAGANVLLLEPEDASIFERSDERDGLRTAKLAWVVADLLTGPGRAPAEGEALMQWMAEHEGAWRG